MHQTHVRPTGSEPKNLFSEITKIRGGMGWLNLRDHPWGKPQVGSWNPSRYLVESRLPSLRQGSAHHFLSPGGLLYGRKRYDRAVLGPDCNKRVSLIPKGATRVEGISPCPPVTARFHVFETKCISQDFYIFLWVKQWRISMASLKNQKIPQQLWRVSPLQTYPERLGHPIGSYPAVGAPQMFITFCNPWLRNITNYSFTRVYWYTTDVLNGTDFANATL